MPKLTAGFMFSGYSDYWHGASGRGETGGAAFAYYGRDTTLRDLVDQWVEDSWTNDYDFEGMPEDFDDNDVRAAILDSFTEAGRADYNKGTVCEFSREWDDCNPPRCADCDAFLDEEHEEGCDTAREKETEFVEIEDCDDDEDCGESPVAIMWIEWGSKDE